MDNELPVRPNFYRTDSLSGSAPVVATTTSLAGRDLVPATTSVMPEPALIFIIATRSQPTLLPRPARADSNPFA